ncbi:TadE family type IV pilus minor pilin [Actinosynnema sp. CS-041913]|uniref:TadE family type IV pilus minor pilin n=1 Tax=Actinosynnema sp. CS-041913 TaxID=3239917 RepID=UPI003D8ED538
MTTGDPPDAQAAKEDRPGRVLSRGGDRGAVTVEAALAICGVLAFVVLGAEVILTVVGQLRCTDAAREAARLVARGDSARAPAAVAAIAPAGAELVVHRDGDTARVEVAARRGLVDLRARAYAVLEPGVADAGQAPAAAERRIAVEGRPPAAADRRVAVEGRPVAGVERRVADEG